MIPRPEADESKILNCGLHLAMEWGEDWLRPIQQRLAKRFPQLTQSEFNHYDSVCRAAMEFGHSLVATLAKDGSAGVDYSAWEAAFLARYPWVDSENLSRAFDQGMYYRLK